MDYSLIFTIGFAAILFLAILRGYFKGRRKSLYYFIMAVVFYTFFFATLNPLTEWLYQTSLPGLETLDPLTATTLEGTVANVISESDENVQVILTHPEAEPLVKSFAIMGLKIAWAAIYFTVGWIVYWLISHVIGLLFVKNKKDPETKKKILKRGQGAFVGVFHGVFNVAMSLILLGGLISLNNSMLTVIDALESLQEPSSDVITLNETSSSLVDESIVLEMRAIVSGFESNPIVGIFDILAVDGVPFYLALFDQVVSLEYENQQILVRRELALLASLVVLVDAQGEINLATLSPTQVEDVFDQLAQSSLIAAVLPVAVRVAADELSDQDIDVSEYETLNWQEEIKTLGRMMALGLSIAQAAGVFDDDQALTTTRIDSDDVEALFSTLGESSFLALTFEVLFDSLTQSLDEPLNLVLVWPENLDFAQEMDALGTIVLALVDQNISLPEGEESWDFISLLQGFDFTLFVDSTFISQALIKVLDGSIEFEALDVLSVPENVVFEDTVVNGVITQSGELRNLLSALTALFAELDNFDFQEPSLAALGSFTPQLIDTLFESRIIVATLSDLLTNLDLEGTPLLIPDAVYDNEGYLLKDELVALTQALLIILEAMDETDDEEGFDFDAVLRLTEDDLDTMLASDILASTVGKLLFDFTSDDVLQIPASTLSTVTVNQTIETIVVPAEIKAILGAINALDMGDFGTFDFSANLFANLTDETGLIDEAKIERLFNSKIMHATVSYLILDTLGQDGVLTVPTLNANDEAVSYVEEDLTFLSIDELTALFQAIASLGLDDFNTINALSLIDIIANIDAVLASAILHATLSDQIANAGDGFIKIPVFTPEGDPLVFTAGIEETTFVNKEEIISLFDALEVIGILDLTSITNAINIEPLLGPTNVSNRVTFFNSAIMYATFSDFLIEVDQGLLVIPDQNINTQTDIRLTLFGTSYIARDEIDTLFDALLELGITDVQGAQFDASSVVGKDPQVLFASAIIQATVSPFVLNVAGDEDTPGNGLVVPQIVRESITVNGLSALQIEQSELIKLFESLQLLNVSDYSAGLSPQVITALSDEELDLVFESVSIHATAHQILDQNATFTVPSQAVVNTTYGAVVSRNEIKALIQATQIIGQDSFTNFSLSFQELLSLDSEDVDVLLESKIVRNLLTPSVEAFVTVNPFLSLTANDYMDNDVNSFLTAEGISRVLGEVT